MRPVLRPGPIELGDTAMPVAPFVPAATFGDAPARIGRVVVLVFGLIALGAWAGFWGQEWSVPVSGSWEPPSAKHWLGTTVLGQDILARALVATRTAFEVGLIVAVAATLFGTLLGAVSGFLAGTIIDSGVLWLKGVLEAIPFYLFVAALAFALKGNPWAMHLAMVASFWTPTARLVRSEVMRIRNLPFVEAARAIGVSPLGVLLKHVLPELLPIVLVQATLTFVAAIKAEVILSFLGLGVQDSMSWGRMIAESTTEILAGQYWNFIAGSGFLFVLVLGFNLFADGLQDALNPKRGPNAR